MTHEEKKNTGIYEKFIVTRTDGKSEPGQKHENCRYFVLDVDHDPHAKAALEAYAQSCTWEYPILAADVWRLAKEPKLQATRSRNSTRIHRAAKPSSGSAKG